MCHCRACVSPNAHDWLGRSPEGRSHAECSFKLVESTQEGRLKNTSGRACLQWGGLTDFKKLTKLYNSSVSPIPVFYAQGQEWRSSALHSPKDASGHCMDATGMLDIRAMTILCLYWGNVFAGQGWPIRCDSPSRPVHSAYNMRAAWPRPLYPIMATTPLDLLHVDFTSIETTLELKKSPRVTNILVFQDHFMKHVLAYVTPNQLAKTVAKFLYQGYISIFRAWPGSWVTGVLTLWAVSSMSCARSLVWRNCRPCLTTCRLMG